MKMWRLANPKTARQANRLETWGRIDVVPGVQRPPAGRTPSSLGDLSLCLLKPSTDWVRPTHIMGGNLLYLKSTDLNVTLIEKKNLHSNIYTDQISEYNGRANT